MPEPVFSLLCTLKTFDLRGNPGINQKTLIGRLACNLTNLKDQTRIDVGGKGLSGVARGSQIYCAEANEEANRARRYSAEDYAGVARDP